ncbi:hypothetical protein N7G274_003242 [Stereocaulon virgatum]|uniref:Nonsense-mediated mRNA decay factor n=1 Tax=Stereocaulon virgatum TaxID=373712 RepID=A0ABR4AD80_9LECA
MSRENHPPRKIIPLERDFLESKRKSAKGYACPVCNDIYTQEPRLWGHGLQNHRAFLGGLGTEEETKEARRQFRQQALEKGQKRAKSDKAAPVPAEPLHWGPSDGWAQNTGRNIDNDSCPNPPTNPASVSEQRNITTTVENPRKRGAERESGSLGLPSEGLTRGSMTSRSRHVRAHSGGLAIGEDPGLSPQCTQREDFEFVRPLPQSTQPLFDPKTESPEVNIRHNLYQGQHISRSPFPPSKPFVSSPLFPRLPQQNDHHPMPGVGQSQSKRPPSNASDQSTLDEDPGEGTEANPEMLLQPETRPISHEQLVIEVKGIYAGLVMVEAKCIDIDERQTAAAQERDPTKRVQLRNDQWQSLIALHKQLLHEHHDFFLASQHPSASPALSRLAAKYSMPARMWRHGIHAFLEVLRHRLPDSLEHMLAFIYIAYTMMALLYETVPAFEDTWIECLGDLGRYRMAIEDDEPKDRETWSAVARFWYNKAADKSPNIGRLYHHLAILAPPYSLEQLSLYLRSLTCLNPFESARGSIMTLFNPILVGRDSTQRRSTSFETAFIRIHGLLFTSKPLQSSEEFDTAIDDLQKDNLLDNHIRKANGKFKETGVHAAIANIAALLEYGTPEQRASKPLFRSFFEKAKPVGDKSSGVVPADSNDSLKFTTMAGGPENKSDCTQQSSSEASRFVISQASRIAFYTFSVALKRPKDRNVYPLVHVYLVFLWSIVGINEAWDLIKMHVPCKEICAFLNSLVSDFEIMRSKDLAQAHSRLRLKDFPNPDQGVGRPLSEDFTLRGQVFTQGYHPPTYFSDAMVDDDERSLNLPSMNEPRIQRLLWLGNGIASANRGIFYDERSKRFMTTEPVELDPSPILISQTVSNEVDSIMSDAGTSESDVDVTQYTPSESSAISEVEAASFTPETASIDPKGFTRASTPTEVRFENRPNLPTSPSAALIEGGIEDIPMVDVSPGKDQRVGDPSIRGAQDLARSG